MHCFSFSTPRLASTRGFFLSLSAAMTALLVGCAAPPTATKPSDPEPLALHTPPQPDPVVEVPEPAFTGPISNAKSFKEYRHDAAKHLYEKNKDRIYKGRMPPLLYAVGTLHVGVNSRGMVDYVHWMRAPSHAPEVMAEIEKTVRAAAPYPAAIELGGVIYTDTWLWHKSGKFQLDTLTEGQDGAVPSRPVAQNTKSAPAKTTEKPVAVAAKSVKPTSAAPAVVKPVKTVKPAKKTVIVAETK